MFNNYNNYRLKITYEEIVSNPGLVNILPLTIMKKLKDDKYIYFDDLSIDDQYKLAYTLFKLNLFIHYSDDGYKVLDYSKLPFLDKEGEERIDKISKEDLINYFVRYNIEVQNLFITVYKEEYKIPIKIPSVFMDLKPDNLYELETDINEFIINTYKKFISVAAGTLPFIPWFGTRIKEYLHDLSVYQVEEMLQAEINGLTGKLKLYFLEKNILDYDFSAEVNAEENIEYGIVTYKIVITINNKQYTIIIK